MHRLARIAVIPVCLALVAASFPAAAQGEELAKSVVDAIEKGKRLLLRAQRPDGSFPAADGSFPVGVTSLSLLALMNTGMTPADPEINRGLQWLRKQDPGMTYEVSLMIMALAAAKDPNQKDNVRILNLVKKLEEGQIRNGENAGSWSYGTGRAGLNLGGDRSNGQYAVLALREAQEIGVPVSLETWRRARLHWKFSQNVDGSWGYTGQAGGGGSGSMTVAGIATMVITEGMVRAGEEETNPDGTPVCCAKRDPDDSLEKAARWLGNNFAVGHNPAGNHWLLYYLYGLERAGRLSGRRFFVNSQGQKHDWYREGAEFLVKMQTALSGGWQGVGSMESDPIVGTSFALLFLSKGLAPVMINKLQYGPRDAAGKQIAGNDWNQHPDDIRNLTQHISNLPKWPKLLTWQTVDVTQATVADLLQAPIVFFNGTERPEFTQRDIDLLRDYIQQGGFIFVERCCGSAAFDEGFRELVKQIVPPSEAQLKKLPADHPVFRSEYNLLDDAGQPTAELWGIDVGCRTSIIYSPHDLSCLWDKWTSFDVPKRRRELVAMITKANRVGVNVVAYVTGRELVDKLTRQEFAEANTYVPDRIERGLLQIAQMRYTGDWNPAPQALRNLLVALNKTVGVTASTKTRDLTALDPNLFKYPLLYLHGRHNFRLGKSEQDKLREYITNGGFLLADACCGVPQFDKSFRELMVELFPDNPLKRIPTDHELYSDKIAHEIKFVKRREPEVQAANASMQIVTRSVEPFLEGIEINGRYVVVYSKYDISCALERQAAVGCTGYVHEDAVKLAVNAVVYALLQ
jgi:hypothetical protein